MRKISRYNHLKPWQNGFQIAYNALTGAVALLKPGNIVTYKSIENKITSGIENSFTPEEQKLLSQMEYAGFVYQDGKDEFETLRNEHRATKHDTTSLGFVIAPTMACNMACQYCFEQNKRGRMSADTMGAILSFIEKKMDGLTELSIGWYGGEPLLAMDIIEKFTAAVFDLKKKHDFKYASTMISNGYLLSKEVVDRLLELKVSTVQVTLDGPSHTHNRKRPLKNGRPSFDTIVENIAYASTKMGISVRVNIDKTYNYAMIAELLDELERAGLKERITLYFGLIEPATSVCGNIAESCFNNADFSKVEVEYFRLLLERGFRIDKLPKPIITFCVAQQVNGFVMDHEGNLYRCFNVIGDLSRSMGNIRNEIDYNHPNFTEMFEFDPFENSQCPSCNILPICLGGCPARRMLRNLSEEEMCESWKHNLPEMLEIIALSRYNKLPSNIKEQA